LASRWADRLWWFLVCLTVFFTGASIGAQCAARQIVEASL
jgi:hypothetical protein